MKVKGVVTIFIILLAFWLILNETLTLPIVLMGTGLSLLLALLFCRECGVFNDLKFTPRAFWYTLVYIFVFLWELFKSNLDMAIRVLSPSLPINPGIIKAKTRLTSRMGRLILANSITLTPGTFTIDIIGDELFIHCVNIREEDREEFGNKIIRKFEKYLEEIYG